jgi:hypothetical protein
MESLSRNDHKLERLFTCLTICQVTRSRVVDVNQEIARRVCLAFDADLIVNLFCVLHIFHPCFSIQYLVSFNREEAEEVEVDEKDNNCGREKRPLVPVYREVEGDFCGVVPLLQKDQVQCEEAAVEGKVVPAEFDATRLELVETHCARQYMDECVIAEPDNYDVGVFFKELVHPWVFFDVRSHELRQLDEHEADKNHQVHRLHKPVEHCAPFPNAHS